MRIRIIEGGKVGGAGPDPAPTSRGSSAPGAGVEEKRTDATVEAAIDDALDMTFPASDPPAWGSLGPPSPKADT